MAVEASFSDDYDPSEPDRPTWGKYHACIIRVDEDGGKQGSMIVDFEIFAGDPSGEEGKVHRDYFHKTIKSFRRIHQLAMACGMVTPAQLKDMKSRGVNPVYDFAKDAQNKQLFFQLEKDQYEGKERAKLGFAMYHPSDPKVAKWPRNNAMLAAGGYDVTTPVNSAAHSNGKTQTPAQAPSTPSTADAVDDLLSGVI